MRPSKPQKRYRPAAYQVQPAGPQPAALQFSPSVVHMLADVHLVDAQTGKRIGRPWLSLVADRYSGRILGHHLSLRPPSIGSVMAAFRNARLPKRGTRTLPSTGDVHHDTE